MSAYRFILVEAFGYQVVEVDGLQDSACLVRSQRIALVSANLSDAQAEAVEQGLLPMLAEAVTA